MSSVPLQEILANRPNVDISCLQASPKRKVSKLRSKAKENRAKGRPSVQQLYPGIVDVARTFVEGNGFRAHRRRQEDTGTCGSTLIQVKQHLLETVPDLKNDRPSIGLRTIARWMKAPNKSFRSSAEYQGLIDARVPAKENSVRKLNENSHFYSARVHYALELASKFSASSTVYSVDNKNKIKVGDQTLAVDRRMKISKFFPTGDAPNYADHDFPTPGYQITPSGYLRMEPSSLMTKDRLGREQYTLPQKYQATVVLRSPHSPCPISSHINDIIGVLRLEDEVARGRSLLVLIVDGGADFNVNYTVNEIFYARLFKETNLDALVVTSYCPGDSALNPIERVWAPCTRALTSVYLPATLDGQSSPPCFQKGTAEEKRAKEHRVFDNAMRLIKDKYWAGITFAGRPIKTVMVPSGSAELLNSAEYRAVHSAVSKSARQLHADRETNELYLFAMNHIDRRIGMAIFAKCTDATCTHCSTHPASSPEMLECVRQFPTPKPSTEFPGHFMTFKEALQSSRDPPCEHMPAFQQKDLGRCQQPSCEYVFHSKKDREDHRLKAHSKRRPTP